MRKVALIVVLLALVPTVVAAAGADAATGTCRHLITDPRGDAYSWFLPTRPYNPQADLLSVDATTTRTTIDFVITMAKVDAKPTTGTDVTIYFGITTQGATAHYSASVEHEVDGTGFSMQNDDTNSVASISGSVDPAAGVYVLRVPRTRIGATYRGGWLMRLGVIASQTAGVVLANGGFIEQSTGPRFRYHVGYAAGCRSR